MTLSPFLVLLALAAPAALPGRPAASPHPAIAPILSVQPPAESEESAALPRPPRPSDGLYALDPTALAFAQYRNERYGVAVEYPKAPFSREEPIGRDEGRLFVTADGSAWFSAAGESNDAAGFTARELLRLSTAHYRETGARVVYTRLADRWYVVSGTQSGRRIFYEKGVLSPDGRLAGTLLIEYPLERKSFFDPIVARMSHSFQPATTRIPP